MQVAASVDSMSRRRARCNHTATHLLQSALKQVLPADIAQQGSSVTFDGLRFDFNLDRPVEVGIPSWVPALLSQKDCTVCKGRPECLLGGCMQADELRQVEGLVNAWIQQGHTLETLDMPLEEAKAAGAMLLRHCRYQLGLAFQANARWGQRLTISQTKIQLYLHVPFLAGAFTLLLEPTSGSLRSQRKCVVRTAV